MDGRQVQKAAKGKKRAYLHVPFGLLQTVYEVLDDSVD